MKPIYLFLFFALTFSGCKPDTSSHSEEEEAYMADYEVPDDLWGFMDTSGALVIEAKYDDVGIFSEGLAAVNQKGKWGYIDRSGEMVIDPVYKSAWAFHEGFARVLPFDLPDQFIDLTGKALQAKDWSAADDFSEGRARVKVGNMYGYIDSEGTLLIQPIYTRGWNFENGLAVVEYQEKLGVINLQGENVIPPEYDFIKKAAKGNIILCQKGTGSIAFDPAGKELLKLANGKMVDSNGKLISVRNGNTMYLIRISDQQKSSHYTNLIYLEEDLWAGKLDSGYVVMDENGLRMNEAYYTQINKFAEGFAAYNKADLWGYLNTSGEELTGEVFGLAWDYRQGFARAAFKDGIAFIDKAQRLAFYPPNGALDMRDFSEGLAAVMID